MSTLAHRVQGTPISIFSEMTLAAQKHNAINLGQGFPNFPAPDFIKEAAIKAITGDINQYTTERGRPRLRQALADKMHTLYGQSIDPDTQIACTIGATEALFATMQGIVNPGDEVIIFEPFFDQYLPAIRFAGGIPRIYTLRKPTFAVDLEELATLFSDKTKAILINSPHNPTGTIFSADIIKGIAALCLKHDAIAICDDVYEHLVFDGINRLPMANVDGMADRTITISSIAKTFSVTGWKTGWAIASPKLIDAINGCHQWTSYCGISPLQEAAADALINAQATGFYDELLTEYQARRDVLFSALETAGLHPIPTLGSFYTMADIGKAGWSDDREFAFWLTEKVGVTPIPPSGFYTNPEDGRELARFAFCKDIILLKKAAERLESIHETG